MTSFSWSPSSTIPPTSGAPPPVLTIPSPSHVQPFTPEPPLHYQSLMVPLSLGTSSKSVQSVDQKSESNSDLGLDCEDSDDDNDNANDDCFKDEAQLPPEHYLAQALAGQSTWMSHILVFKTREELYPIVFCIVTITLVLVQA
ncbi:hypothetical protein AJ79_10254 [Helicocarpus griseus UAMH5409]|uniref:Uncharacterized protein n=1 Tax=Helicocarpus griseus UAMH5409 TaxID=1447875 RepID=A0A2B7WEV0_9EURO|nr:hypothetical protein AJ79_10254 [Helicocarpus griseus UAMH5409]